MNHDKSILSKLGLDYELLDSGCCGMAGSFGFEAGHYDVSAKVGELVLLPAVRQASKDTLIIADGFSCREQIHQATDREALHTAQVLQLALEQARAEHPGQAGTTSRNSGSRVMRLAPAAYPEKIFTERRQRERARANRKAVGALGAAAILILSIWAQQRKRATL